jgi:hypothetical protein
MDGSFVAMRQHQFATACRDFDDARRTCRVCIQSQSQGKTIDGIVALQFVSESVIRTKERVQDASNAQPNQ